MSKRYVCIFFPLHIMGLQIGMGIYELGKGKINGYDRKTSQRRYRIILILIRTIREIINNILSPCADEEEGFQWMHTAGISGVI